MKSVLIIEDEALNLEKVLPLCFHCPHGKNQTRKPFDY